LEYQLRDDAAEAIASFSKLRSLMLFPTQISDRGIVELCRLSSLETLVVSSPNITSASFGQVAKLKHLTHLGIWQWKIDDADFEKLAQLPNLTSLNLDTTLTDTSVLYMAPLNQLERLRLCGEGITNASVPNLMRLTKLEWLDVSNTSINKLGPAAQELKQAFPECAILLPKTEKEKEMERAFHRQKFGGTGF
jgi:Leucine-rich repeat (LRR) protein